MLQPWKHAGVVGVLLVVVSAPALLPWQALAVQSQPGTEVAENTPIKSIRFSGLSNVSETFCRNRIVSAEGQSFSQRTVQEDRRRLIRTGRFLDVQVETRIEAGQALLNFKLQERPTIQAIDFVGNVKFTPKDLLKELDLQVGDPLNRFKIRQGVGYIEQLYREAGYADISVRVDEELIQSERRLVYTIEEGARVRVRQVSFEGNQAFAKKELAGKITTKTYLPLLRDGNLNPDALDRDSAELQRFYHDRGYLDARVSYRSEPLGSEGDVAVTFVIAEGDLYRVDRIEFNGNLAFTDEQLLSAMQLQPESTMRQDLLVADIEAIGTLYGEQGYLYRTISPTRVFTEKRGFVVLKITIGEDEQYVVGRVVVRGNRQTKDKVVRRELEFYPGELFNTTSISSSERNIRSTGLFKLAQITPIGEQEGVRDVIVNAEESEETTSFIIAGGVGSNSGLAGSLSYESRNFDLFDWPRGWRELWGRSFRGAGQYFRIQMSPGSDLSSFRIDFRESHLMDRPLRLGTSFYLFERIREDYDEQRLGTNVSLGKYFEEGLLEGWSGELAFRLEDVELSDLKTFPAEDIEDAKGHSLITSFKGRLTRNRTDSRFFPTTGDRISLAVEQATGDYTFTKTVAEYTRYMTVRRDAQQRASVLAVRGEVGYIFGNAPVFERYYAGGIGSMRGFEFRGISPRDGPFFDDDQRIGGDFRVLTGAEYSFPLWTKTLRGVLFTDMGTVEEDVEISSWRASVGFGIRLYIERLGPVPFEFNLAAPVVSDDDDDEQVFSFALGFTF